MKPFLYRLLIVALFSTADARADLKQGIADYDRKNYPVALVQLKPLAEKGDPLAQLYVGLLSLGARGVTPDFTAAAKWFRLAAKQGNARAQNELGVLYDNGQGLARDYGEAIKWYRLAAEQGYAAAQTNLGVHYDGGYGVRQSYREAVNWFRLAAEQGSASAQNNLGVMYADGLGVTVSRVVAFALYSLSAAGDPSAANRATINRNEIVARMSKEEIAAGNSLAKELSGSKTWLKTLDQWCERHAIKRL